MIKSVEDLYENVEYYLYIGKDLKGNLIIPRRVRLLGIVQEFKNSEFYVGNLSRSKKQSYWVTGIYGIHESGIGKTEQEAIANFRKIQDAKLDRAYGSQEAVHEDLRKVEVSPTRYTYYNYRNVRE